jgi:hypothetical protein
MYSAAKYHLFISSLMLMMPSLDPPVGMPLALSNTLCQCGCMFRDFSSTTQWTSRIAYGTEKHPTNQMGYNESIYGRNEYHE